MDLVNTTMAQVTDLIKSMTPAARIILVLLIVAIAISIGFLVQVQTTGGDGYLMSGRVFSGSELPAMEAAFAQAGLNAYTIEGNRIRIPLGQQSSYVAALADGGALPSDFGSYLSDAAGKLGPFTGRTQHEALLKVAVQKELAAIIRAMDGIENAAVHYDAQRKSGFRQQATVTASVSVKPRGTQPLDPRRFPAIRHLVAAAIADLSPEQVTIVDLNTGKYSAGNQDGLGTASDDPVLDRTRQWQELYEDQILASLAFVPGVTVTANVVLDHERHHREEQLEVDPQGVVPLSQREEEESTNTEGEAQGGRPGFEAQQPNAPTRLTAASKGPTSSQERTTTDVQNAASHTKTTIEHAPFTPRQVTVSVGVPSSYYQEIWLQQNPAPSGQTPPQPTAADLAAIEAAESIKIRDHVAKQVPVFDPNVSPQSLVTVTTFMSVATAPLPLPGFSEQALGWLSESWSTLGMFGLVAFSLVMLRSMVRGSAATGEAAPAAANTASAAGPAVGAAAAAGATSETSGADEGPATGAEASAGGKLKRRAVQPSLQDELVELVREDPDGAAAILRGWIGNAN